MISLLTRARCQTTLITSAHRQGAVQPGRHLPRMSTRPRKASFYFDASRHTALSLRLLLQEANQVVAPERARSARHFLCLTVDQLLTSIRPGMEDDMQSRRYFEALLRLHLSHLSSEEIQKLSETLKLSGFDCHVMETIVDDVAYLDYGFSNGPPHSFNRMLLQTADFFNLLDDAKEKISNFFREPLTIETQKTIRHLLATLASAWADSAKTPEDLRRCICQLAKVLDLPAPSPNVQLVEAGGKATTVSLTPSAFIIDPAMNAAMLNDSTGSLFAEVLRDILELLITQKLFGTIAPPDRLTQQQRLQLSATLEKIYTTTPATTDTLLKQKARAVLADMRQFGTIQIQPTAGVALGHAWISPSLSMVPDKRKMAVDLGSRYMHSGFHLEPGHSQIRQWPAYFMSARENEETYPSQHAWHLRVPVTTDRLEAAAEAVKREWQAHDLPYRFIGTAPDMPATGCRITVWEAVRRGMTTDARTLFDYYNQGLPPPQSPTELWQRLENLMQWMTALATD
jgi:hypothetical protein